MRFLHVPSKYYCGIDLHLKSMYITVMDRLGNILLHRNLPCCFETFLRYVEPFLPDLIVGVESVYLYYWLFDRCQQAGIPFYLGHAYYMKVIHGGKNKHDRLDSKKITGLMRTDFFPLAYPYPKEKRATRDLLRRRHKYVRLRSGCYTHIQVVFGQHGIQDVTLKQIKDKKNRRDLINRFSDPALKKLISSNLDHLDFLDPLIRDLEKLIIKQAQFHDKAVYNLLLTIPGVGPIIALTILYEVDSFARFDSVQAFSSYCRLVKCDRSSAGKFYGGGNAKIGNAYLKWVFTSIIKAAQKKSPVIHKYYQRLQSKFKVARARTIIAHKFAVAVYFMVKNKTAFDENRFVQTTMK